MIMRVTCGFLGLVLLGSCGTPEYRAEQSLCRAEWQQKIPPRYEQQLVERVRYEQRPTGQTNCTTVGNQTSCQQVMTTISIPYTAVETVDVLSSRRDVQIEACTVRACAARYGNPECKTGS
ncbi:hypothetical protein C5F48_12800 [Cereibacter changlensis JA139]|jgi:hypothetical protein|uniref:Lipoprotein n=2 Tax=Cereibacter changlensis TaxID=402884 RepID=A0A2T4JTR4_9RHOB|nr:hypothetical protein C5F48_12800 [Cereibacter changlensis JA139]